MVDLKGDSKIATPWVEGHPRMIRNSLSRVSAMLLAFVVGLAGDSKIAVLTMSFDRCVVQFCFTLSPPQKGQAS